MNKQESIVPSESQEPYKALVADIGRELYGDPHVDLLSALNEEPDFGKLTQALQMSWERRWKVNQPYVRAEMERLTDRAYKKKVPNFDAIQQRNREDLPETGILSGLKAMFNDKRSFGGYKHKSELCGISAAITSMATSEFIAAMRRHDYFAQGLLQQMGPRISSESSLEQLAQLAGAGNLFFLKHLIKENADAIQSTLNASTNYPQEDFGSGLLAMIVLSSIIDNFNYRGKIKGEQMKILDTFLQNLSPEVLIGIFRSLHWLRANNKKYPYDARVTAKLFSLEVSELSGFGAYYNPEQIVELARANPDAAHLLFGDKDFSRLNKEAMREILLHTKDFLSASIYLAHACKHRMLSIADLKYIIDGNAEAEARMKGRWLEIYANAALKAVTDLFSRQKTA